MRSSRSRGVTGTVTPFALPSDNPLAGSLLVGENAAEEVGSRPSNNAPDALHLAKQNPDGTPDYHGWPDRFGFLPSNQAVFNPVGSPLDALCVFDASNPPSMCTPASLKRILTENVPIRVSGTLPRAHRVMMIGGV